MAKSLLNHCPAARLFILCFDDLSFELVEKLNMPGITPIALSAFEDNELKRVKDGRTQGEYCWTATSSLPLYLFRMHPEIDLITYLDADLMFFSSPEPVFTLMGEQSILITPHRYTPKYDQTKTSGIYCVQYVSFKRDQNGMEALQWWRDRCLEWCYNYYEDGKFGDQKYLDDWPSRFKNVYVCGQIGAGAAPWNIQQYQLSLIKNHVYINDVPLIFYHFHSLKVYKDMRISLVKAGSYTIQNDAVEYVYKPYREALYQTYREMNQISQPFLMGLEDKPREFSLIYLNFRRRLRGTDPIREQIL